MADPDAAHSVSVDEPNCAICVWWRAHDRSVDEPQCGYCRRRAPVRSAESERALWPMTYRMDVCGDFCAAGLRVP